MSAAESESSSVSTIESKVSLSIEAPEVAFVGERVLVRVLVAPAATLKQGGKLQLQAWKSEELGEKWTTIGVHSLVGGESISNQFEQELPQIEADQSHTGVFEVGVRSSDKELAA